MTALGVPDRTVPRFHRYAVVERRYPLIHEVRVLSTHLTQAGARRVALRRAELPHHQDSLGTRVEPTDRAPVGVRARRVLELLAEGPRSVVQLVRVTAMSPHSVVEALLLLSRQGWAVCRSGGDVVGEGGRPRDAVWRMRTPTERHADLLGQGSHPSRVDYLRGSG